MPRKLKGKVEPKLIFKCPEGTQCQVPLKVIKKFPRISNMVQPNHATTIVELTGTNKKIIDDLQRYFQMEAKESGKDIVILEPLRGYSLSDSISPKPWADLCTELNHEDNSLHHLCLMLKISQNLDMHILWKFLCACIAQRLKAKDLVETRQILRIP